MKILFLTAGAAGMFCGSCMHDNALARSLRDVGVDCLLQPIYTPIRTDQPSIASQQVFFGGVNIYLLQKFPSLRWLPRSVRRLFDSPRFLAWATARASSTDASGLGDLAITMLRGEDSVQRGEVKRMVAWLRDEIRPDAIIFTNLLIGGPLPTIRRELPKAKCVVILQGDDAFIDFLPASYQPTVVAELSRLAADVDRFIVNSHFYAGKMSRLLSIPIERFVIMPLTIDPIGLEPLLPAVVAAQRRPAIGYLARISPEKGLHHLVDAFILLAGRAAMKDVCLLVAGWLGEQHRDYFESIRRRIAAAGLADRFEYLGSPDLRGKAEMLHRIDVLSVPTVQEEPKGLFVLEALAAGVPVVQPSIGAFPELIESTGGGLLVPPGDAMALADALERLLIDPVHRRALADAGRAVLIAQRTTRHQAVAIRDLIQSIAPVVD